MGLDIGLQNFVLQLAVHFFQIDQSTLKFIVLFIELQVIYRLDLELVLEPRDDVLALGVHEELQLAFDHALKHVEFDLLLKC